ncbi:isochorismatase family protein [Peribacillus muralis]|uniref:isochorismatase family protein n=1 Tax=Peribacillus muralis TaxID=264697 RepID=UPI003D066B44
MSIPTILPYPMPKKRDLPQNRVSWEVNPKRAVLLVHDMQQYFLNAYDSNNSPITELIINIQSLKSQCEKLGIPVIYTAQPGNQNPTDRALLTDFWGTGLEDEFEQTKIIEEVAPTERDIVLTKWRYSAFKRTDLLDIMHDQGRDQLIICGIYAHIGCLITASDAFMQDIQPFFVADAVADFSLEDHQMVMKYAADRCAVTITTQDILDSLRNELNSVIIKADNSNQLQNILLEKVAFHLEMSPSEINEEDNLIDLGLDSIRIMSLVESLRQSGLDLSYVDLAERPTLADWKKLISYPGEKV